MFYSTTDIGKVRLNNEDAILIDEGKRILVLADGMGGHNCGEIASNIAVKTAFSSIADGLSQVRKATDDVILEILIKAASTANQAVITFASSSPDCSRMGTTLVEALIIRNKLYLYNVGDSKCFLLRKKLIQLTEDHTVANMMKKHGTSPLNIPSNANHALTQAIGLAESLFPATSVISLKKGDTLLFCTDGLTDMVNNVEITNVLYLPISIEEKGTTLVEKANAAGGKDNVTVAIYHHC